ncbi:MAG: arginase [Clostridiales bacterium]|nr:arginase [Clostridiales bacterium]
MKKRIDILGANMDFGASKRGVNLGPKALRFAGLCEGIESLGYEYRDLGNLDPLPCGKSLPSMRNYEQVVEMNRRIYESTLKSLQDGAFPLLLGGDHSVAAGSVSAVAKFHEGQKIGLIWVDAHGDWNDETSTDTGNMHGMPFSAVCGAGPDIMVDYGQGPVFVDPAKCVQIAGRMFDKEEIVRMKEAGITVLSIDVIDRMGILAVMNKAIEIAGSGTAGIHLSFDIDSVTPESAPGTGTTVHSGLTVREAFTTVEILADSGKVISMDIVEVNPILDEKNRTAQLASEIVLSTLGKKVF